MAAYPVRGLDINSSYTIYNLLTKQKEEGRAVIFVGEDLDVLIELCDRIMVINAGKITGIVDARTAKREEIGLLMTKSTGIHEDTNLYEKELGIDES
jgi:simple sugar transport system ATP-binding protein